MESKIKYIDLFAGIGGLSMPFEEMGCELVLRSENNSFANTTYLTNHPHHKDLNVGDITLFDEMLTPDHDILLAGFPCQPFSGMGVNSKEHYNQTHGFEDKTRGTLFFDILRILKHKRPKMFLLENVMGLLKHDKGNTFKIIMDSLNHLGYHVHYKLMDATPVLPQIRNRVYIVGFRDSNDFNFEDVKFPQIYPKLKTILHKLDGSEPVLPHDKGKYFNHQLNCVEEFYNMSDKYMSYLESHKAKHRAKGNWYGYKVRGEGDVMSAVCARYGRSPQEGLIAQEGKNPRMLTPRECARLMGFPDSFIIPVSNHQSYVQFGNSVAVPMIRCIAQHSIKYI